MSVTVSDMAAEPIDLLHLGSEKTIGAYVLETDAGPALHDGPSSCIEQLERGLQEHGLELAEIRHLLLSHIHLDPRRGGSVLVRRHPPWRFTSPVGAPHLVDPTRLRASARRATVWRSTSFGASSSPCRRRTSGSRRVTSSASSRSPTPGHAWHHVSYLHRDGTLYAGDAAGVRIEPARFVLPPCPPPELDLEAWEQTLDEIERRGPSALATIHFGVFEDVRSHLARLRETLSRWGSGSRTEWTRRRSRPPRAPTSRRATRASRMATTGPRRSGRRSTGSSATGAKRRKLQLPDAAAKRRRSRPARDEPTAARKQAIAASRADQHEQRRPDAAHSPVPLERSEQHGATAEESLSSIEAARNSPSPPR